MKKLIITMLMLLGTNAMASDAILKQSWKHFTKSDNFHFFDNLKPAVFWDFSEKKVRKLAGGTTQIYAPKTEWAPNGYLSVDIGLIADMGKDGSSDSDGNKRALPVGGINIPVGFYLSQIPVIKQASILLKKSEILAKFDMGGWGARDWYTGQYRYGAYTGLKLLF